MINGLGIYVFHGTNQFNRHARIYMRGRIWLYSWEVSKNGRYKYRGTMRCNNCKGTYWACDDWESFPRYCWNCQCMVRQAFRGKFWDDEEEILF